MVLKIISKAENFLINLEELTPSKRAIKIARETGKLPKLVQAILDHSKKIIAVVLSYEFVKDGVFDFEKIKKEPEICLKIIRNNPCFLITIDEQGRISSDAGINVSNHPQGVVNFPPADPHDSAQKIRREMRKKAGKNVAAVIADTEIIAFDTVDLPRGSSGINVKAQKFAKVDRFEELTYKGAALIGCQLTSAASLLLGQTDGGIPVVIM